jgi:hypothetical protein
MLREILSSVGLEEVSFHIDKEFRMAANYQPTTETFKTFSLEVSRN